ncbi:hypothetical protein SD77_3387 [Bacillus badius]|uniref:Mobile element protein n=1 Tax=Bacillus badius TaxID=1455 RepID=A0ABR5AXQ0_BACBA|nr:hypothetical protein SD78_0021 [Bacillus badius]KIL79521.1 hypothetical protein SD77_3387 [Bacillus badius]
MIRLQFEAAVRWNSRKASTDHLAEWASSTRGKLSYTS